MAKQSYSIKGTNIANGDAVGNQIEQTVSVDDNILPAPQELAEYQKIDPKIVDFLIKSSEREQQHQKRIYCFKCHFFKICNLNAKIQKNISN